MEKLIFKTITSEAGLLQFIEKVENYTHVKLPLTYVQSSKVVGVFLQDCMVGGYMLVTKPSFRSLMFVPDKIKETHSFFKKDAYEMMEVNGLWIGPAVKTPKGQMAIWVQVVKDIFLSRKKYVLLLSDSRNRAVKHMHDLANPEYIYEGAPQLLGGEKTHQKIRFGFTTRWNLLFNIPRYYQEYRARVHRIESTSGRRTIQAN